MKFTHLKEALIYFAKEKYGNISPCNGDLDYNKCFTHREEYGQVVFWFNDEAGSTHIVKESQVRTEEEMKNHGIAHSKLVNGVRIITYCDGTREFIYPDGTVKIVD